MSICYFDHKIVAYWSLISLNDRCTALETSSRNLYQQEIEEFLQLLHWIEKI